MAISTYYITTSMGKTRDGLPFLSKEELDNFNSIGYSSKDLKGNKISRTDYLNSLGKGEFKVELTKFNNGDFEEKFTIIRVL